MIAVELHTSSTGHPDTSRAHPGIAEPVTPGLGVSAGTSHEGKLTGLFTVTHLPSGYRLSPSASCLSCAHKAAQLAADSGVDWTLTGDEIKADPRAKEVAKEVWLLQGGCRSRQDCAAREEWEDE